MFLLQALLLLPPHAAAAHPWEQDIPTTSTPRLEIRRALEQKGGAGGHRASHPLPLQEAISAALLRQSEWMGALPWV